MGKLTTYIIVMSGLMLLFYFAGLLDGTPNSALLNFLLNPENIRGSDLDLQVLLVLEGIAAASIVIGFTLAGNIELGVMGVFTIFIMNLFWDFLRVYDKVHLANPVLALLLFAPLLIMFSITLVEWWRGRD